MSWDPASKELAYPDNNKRNLVISLHPSIKHVEWSPHKQYLQVRHACCKHLSVVKPCTGGDLGIVSAVQHAFRREAWKDVGGVESRALGVHTAVAISRLLWWQQRHLAYPHAHYGPVAGAGI